MLMVLVMPSFMDFSGLWYNKNMEEKQSILKKYLAYIKNNKNNVYVIAAIMVIILLTTGLIALIAINSNKNSSGPTPTPSQAAFQISPSTNNPAPTLDGPIITPEPTETAIIENQTQPQITPNVAAPYTVSNITKYGNTWATMNITNPNVGSGAVIVKKVNNVWTVVMGPGSFFSRDDLQSLGAPQELIDSFITSPSVSVSPSQSPSPQTGD